jgi:TctA family transporter
MKNYLNTFKGDSKSAVVRRFGFTMTALVFSLLIAMFNAVNDTMDNKILETLLDFFLGFSLAVIMDLIFGIGRMSPLIPKKDKIVVSISQLPFVEDVLSQEQIYKATEFYNTHKKHVDAIMEETPIATDVWHEDKGDPRLWKPQHWNWFFNWRTTM